MSRTIPSDHTLIPSVADGGYRFETLAVHAGQCPDATGSRGIPVYRTSSYVFRSTAHAADLFALKEPGHIYSRLSNPTTEHLESRLTALEGGRATTALASGTAAIFSAIVTLAEAGDEILAADNLYGGTTTQFDAILPKLGIRTRFLDPRTPDRWEAAVTDRTRAFFVETLGNPSLDVTDIEAMADAAHRHGLPLIVDGTFTTPYLLRTIDRGADIVVNSLTKWLGGHGAALGGSVTEAGAFDWTSGRHPLLTQPDANFHGRCWATDLPEPLRPLAYTHRLRTVPLRNLGPCLSPDNAWLFLQGIETLPLRMDRHCRNALTVARHLAGHGRVRWVRYPGLAGDPSYETARTYLKRGFGGMVVIGLEGGYDAAVTLIDNIRLFSHLANVGDARSLILHPASTTHAQLAEEQRRAAGVTPDLVRLSIGLEHADDLIRALDDGLSLT